jgi:hypothetical protein
MGTGPPETLKTKGPVPILLGPLMTREAQKLKKANDQLAGWRHRLVSSLADFAIGTHCFLHVLSDFEHRHRLRPLAQ